MKSLSLRKIRFILRHSRAGELSASRIIKMLRISKSAYYRVLRRYANVQNIDRIKMDSRIEKKPGRKSVATPYSHVSKILEYRLKFRSNANSLKILLKEKEKIDLSHYRIYHVLRSAGMVKAQKKKKKRNKWVRFERKHSLSLWQTDWTHFKGRWLIVVIDDASRLVVGWGLFDNATSENSVEVLKKAIKKHGKPKAMLTGRDVQFYCTEKEGVKQGKTQFQLFLDKNGIKHILARVNHPQTCGKIERFFGEVKTRIIKWKDFDSVDEVVQWHNELKPHMSLDFEKLETPVQAFQRKMHYRKNIIKDYLEV